MSNKKQTILYAFIALLVLVLPTVAQFYTDFLWFDAQTLTSVFFTNISYQLSVFFSITILSVAFLYAVLVWTEKNIRKEIKKYKRSPLSLPILGFISILAGLAYSSQWDVVLRYVNSFSFSATDPIFNNNISFYVYQLPLYELALSFLSTLATIALILALALYAIHFKKTFISSVEDDVIQTTQTPSFDFQEYKKKLKEHAYAQLLLLGAFLLLTSAIGYYFQRYNLLFSTQGSVYGLGYAESLIQLPALWILAVLSLLGAIAFVINTKTKNDKVVVYVLLAIIGLNILATGATVLTQSLVVEPDELNKEYDFIANEIQYTRQGFGLNEIQREDLQINDELSREQLQRQEPTIDNVRLWDDRPLLQTLNEIQIFRTYYTFPNIDVGRYEVNDERTLMMLAPREIDISGLAQQSQTWVNRHMVYTHGFGAVMAPASKVTEGNLPELVIQDIPPNSSVGIDITQPRIYYGEQTTDYAIVNTETQELDYPSGEQNIRINYPGEGGVLLDSTLKQLAYAIQQRSPQILFSGSITDESRIQYHRQITDRARTLAPFLQYDRDPYLVIANGSLYWIQDAYTTTNAYPYSNPVNYQGRSVNYMRNSAKAVINAYDGEVTFYVTESDDPLINTYQKAYPQLFSDLSEMPQEIRDHIRYPQDIFSVQGQRYQEYHMQEPNTFYNREDAWRIPNEVVRGFEQPLRPYYQLMQLPGQVEAEFIQVQPFIPRGRENLIGWLAARSDAENYGEIQAFHFSKQELTFGPMQIESRIDQDTDISQQITLWSRSGSGVIRGNLLVIPIEDTILYVEPLFLESTEQGSLPQLMRVIAVHEDQIAMAPTLEQALNAIIDPTISVTEPIITDPGSIAEIREAFNRAQEALEQGDLRTYADRLEEVERLLKE